MQDLVHLSAIVAPDQARHRSRTQRGKVRPMTTERQSLDEFLNNQTDLHSALLATIDRVADDQTLVKVTPWLTGQCMCVIGLDIPKNVIEAVAETGDSVSCCSKRMRVVRVFFKDPERLLLNGIFKQLISYAREENNHGVSNTRRDYVRSWAGTPIPTQRSCLQCIFDWLADENECRALPTRELYQRCRLAALRRESACLAHCSHDPLPPPGGMPGEE